MFVPVTVTGYGVWFAYWRPEDYQAFFAIRYQWPPTLTAEQPLGVLHSLIDVAAQNAPEQPKETATDKLATIAGHKKAG